MCLFCLEYIYYRELLQKQHCSRLPKRVVFGNLEGAMRKGWSRKSKEWTDCVQSDIRAFGIAEGWKATALEAGVD